MLRDKSPYLLGGMVFIANAREKGGNHYLANLNRAIDVIDNNEDTHRLLEKILNFIKKSHSKVGMRWQFKSHHNHLESELISNQFQSDMIDQCFVKNYGVATEEVKSNKKLERMFSYINKKWFIYLYGTEHEMARLAHFETNHRDFSYFAGRFQTALSKPYFSSLCSAEVTQWYSLAGWFELPSPSQSQTEFSSFVTFFDFIETSQIKSSCGTHVAHIVYMISWLAYKMTKDRRRMESLFRLGVSMVRIGAVFRKNHTASAIAVLRKKDESWEALREPIPLSFKRIIKEYSIPQSDCFECA
ncbi:hypothetical protein Tco_0674814 [Tanacetum coccineum]